MVLNIYIKREFGKKRGRLRKTLPKTPLTDGLNARSNSGYMMLMNLKIAIKMHAPTMSNTN